MAANQNVTQLTQQTVSANTTSLFYAVTGGTTDTGLPLSVLVNNLGLTGTPTTPTATGGTNTTQIASTAFVQTTVGAYALLTGAAFTGVISVTTSGSTQSILVADTGTSGSNIKLTGDGGTTPSKTLRVKAGAFQIMNNAYGAVILTVTDAGGFSTNNIDSTPIGANTPSTGAFSTLSTTGLATLNSMSTGSATITGGSINAAPIGAITASTGKFTTVVATSTITPSTTAGVIGTTLADSANAGSVGEYITATSSSTGLTTTSVVNITSISLTAGDWDVTGSFNYTAAGSTTTSLIQCGISTTSVTMPSNPLSYYSNRTEGAGLTQQQTVPTQRINVSVTTTVYLVYTANFAVSTATGQGYLRARRVR